MSAATELPTVDQSKRGLPSSKPVSVSSLLIVGGGMSGFGLCDRLVKSGATSQWSIRLIGDEPTPAYDRVNLSQLFRGRTPEDLALADAEWYRDHGIELQTGCRIQSIDRERKWIVDRDGNRYPYDRLVLATGSRARVPPIPGADSPGVFVYRTLSDLHAIHRHTSGSSARRGAVIGGGLLGLEAAKVLRDLGLNVSVIEMAPGLMPRQLDAVGAQRLKSRIESLGVDVHLVRRMESIRADPRGQLILNFVNASPMSTDIVIIAAGVIPNDELARDAGLEVAPRGGIVVDERLQTSDASIDAIGECVSFRGHVYGLVAPCYRMADVLAGRLIGVNDRFQGADESAELKLLDVQVAALGRAIGNFSSGIPIAQSDQSGYRKLILSQGRIVGASCVGDWDELPRIRQAVHDQARLWPWQRNRFLRTGSPWASSGPMPVALWPKHGIVCSCHAITKGTLSELVAQGCSDPDQLARATGASTACGSCRSLVCELAGGAAFRVPVPAARSMGIASLAAMVMAVLWLMLPPLPLATSVQDGWRRVDILWRSDLARQVTGFTLVGLLAVALVFSLRKRVAGFRWGSYAAWRAVHGILGALVMVAMAVHTGLRLGHNLNFVLGSVFLATAVLGGFAGWLSSLEGRLEGNGAMLVRQWRPRITQVHRWLFWPLPLLIAFHIVSFYWFND